MQDLENNGLEKFDIDDIFVLIPKNKIEVLIKFNSYHNRLKVTYEIENLISFLNITIIRNKENILKKNWYHKKTYSGRLINYFSNYYVYDYT